MSLGNLTGDNIPLDDAIVGAIRVDERNIESGLEFMLPRGITIGSDAQEVIDAFGIPSETRGDTTFRRYVYELDIQVDIVIRILVATNEVDEISMMNFVERPESTFDGTLTPLQQGYVAPTALGDDLSLGIVELEGVVYQLPVPVAVMLNNGWVLADEHHMIPAGRTAVGQRIRYGNQVMRVSIRNYDSVEAPATEGFVISVEFNHHQWQGSIVLPGGITPSSTQEEVKALLGEHSRESESGSFHSFSWNVTRYNRMQESISINFRTDDDSEEVVIHSISVERDLSALPWE